MKKEEQKTIYKTILWNIFALLAIGIITYVSASLGNYVKNEHIFWVGVIKHIGLGVFGGLLIMFLLSKMQVNILKKYAPILYILGIILTALVFVPGLGFAHGGARRWISLRFISFQPVEILKLSTVIFLSFLLEKYRDKVRDLKFFLLYFLALLPVVLILYKQPDTSSIVLIFAVSLILIFSRGAKWKHVLSVVVFSVFAFFLLVHFSPYIQKRIDVFLHPEHDQLGAGFQSRQAKKTIGSGKIFGRGLGQSTQKFGPYLPESSSDSIFAIFAEENGFLGSFVLLFLYLLLSFFGLRVSKRSEDVFSQNLALAITLLIVVQSFLNIATISGLIPLSGFPLIFFSSGGTALLVSLAEIGILLSIARNLGRKK